MCLLDYVDAMADLRLQCSHKQKASHEELAEFYILFLVITCCIIFMPSY